MDAPAAMTARPLPNAASKRGRAAEAPLAAADRATAHYLARMRWTIAQIADYLGQERATIVQVLREPPPTVAPAPPSTPSASSPVAPALQVRLSRDARRLQIRLPVEAVPTPTTVLLDQIRAECARLRLPAAPTVAELDQCLETCVYGAWRTVLEAAPPTPPIPGRVTLLVPVPTPGRRARGTATAPLVRSGTVLARCAAGQPGQPGWDLRGRPIPPRPPRMIPLPQGEQTTISADGTELVAACDGQVVLRHLRLHVLPTTILDGDLTADEGVLEISGAAIVTGTVREGGTVTAHGDLAIRRGMQMGCCTSVTGSIIVEGGVAGTAVQPSALQAGRDITCGRVLHGTLRAEGDLVLQGDAHHSTLEAGGNLYLPAALEECLFNVRLSVGGGLVVPIAPLTAGAPQADAPTERQHTRIPVTLPAQLARHGPPPFTFTPCVIEDLSPGGARCQVATSAEELAPGMIVQLKWELPESPGQVIAIARVAHTGAPAVVGLAFLQITEHDADRVMQFCLQQMRTHQRLRPGTRADRRTAT